MSGPTSAPDPDPHDLLDEVGLTPGDVADLLAAIRSELGDEVAVVADERATGGVIPVVEFADVERGRVADAIHESVARRGVVVVRGTFERAEAEAWDREIGQYIAANGYEDRLAARDPERVVTGSSITGIYWSRPQVFARQHERMVTVRRFLNGFWRHRSARADWFDPDHDIGYPDRLRRRPPGSRSRGLRPHIDSVATCGWRVPENQRTFRDVLSGRPDLHDPWTAAHRTTLDDCSEAPSSVFRSFQGWTALSDMRPEDGGLRIVPIPVAVALSLVEGLAGELGLLPDGPAEAPRHARIDDLLLPALTPIPAVEPGDTVWWHGDLFHAVAAATNVDRWSNVMYIGSSPRCPRNDRYASSMFERFEAGRSPADFPPDDDEASFEGRARPTDLDPVGRQQFGLDPIVRK